MRRVLVFLGASCGLALACISDPASSTTGGGIACAGATCQLGSVCCGGSWGATLNNSDALWCSTAADVTKPSPTGETCTLQMLCDDVSDCAPNELCCATNFGLTSTGNVQQLSGSRCANACDVSQAPLCTLSDMRCPTGTSCQALNFRAPYGVCR